VLPTLAVQAPPDYSIVRMIMMYKPEMVDQEEFPRSINRNLFRAETYLFLVEKERQVPPMNKPLQKRRRARRMWSL
jgi:hypothetical protein